MSFKTVIYPSDATVSLNLPIINSDDDDDDDDVDNAADEDTPPPEQLNSQHEFNRATLFRQITYYSSDQVYVTQQNEPVVPTLADSPLVLSNDL